MKQHNILNIVAKVSENTAIKQAGIISRCLIYQPKTPTRLLNKNK